MKYYAKVTNIGNSIQDVLDLAVEAKLNGVWHYVLGYDRGDDVLSLSGTYGSDVDIDITCASTVFTNESLKISSEVGEDILF